MSKVIRHLLQTIFALILVAGIIGFAIPFDFENFSYSTNNNVLEIKNKSDETYEDAEITISYTLYSLRGNPQPSRSFKYHLGKISENSTYNPALPLSTEYPTFKINSITIKTEDEEFDIYKNPYFSGINWTFICFIIVGFFGLAITSTIKKAKEKEEEEEYKVKKTFQERIREAFTPVMDTINTVKKTYEDSSRKINGEDDSQKKDNEEKPHKVTCSYCKGKYNSNEDKCPHCGAPPEPYN